MQLFVCMYDKKRKLINPRYASILMYSIVVACVNESEKFNLYQQMNLTSTQGVSEFILSPSL